MARKFPRNLLQEHVVIAADAGNSYNPRVTNDEIWRAVGAYLKARREFLGYENQAAVRRADRRAPDVRMMQEVESGRPRTLTLLAKYCDVLGVSLHVVLADVLAPCDVTAPALQVARAFDEMSPEAQEALMPVLRLPGMRSAGAPRAAGGGPSEPTPALRAPRRRARQG